MSRIWCQSKKAENEDSGETINNSANLKEFSLSTFKYHSLQHYPAEIVRVGTLDSVSAQRVSFFPML